MAVRGQKEQPRGALERASRDVERLVELNLPRIEFLPLRSKQHNRLTRPLRLFLAFKKDTPGRDLGTTEFINPRL